MKIIYLLVIVNRFMLVGWSLIKRVLYLYDVVLMLIKCCLSIFVILILIVFVIFFNKKK